MTIRILFIALFTAVSLSASSQTTKYVGGDVSMLPKYEEANVAYYDINGTKIENGKLLEFFRDDAMMQDSTLYVCAFSLILQEKTASARIWIT